ncbi:putative protein N(5)-glutamine methyltransferase, partial [Streptomyces mesophilus]
MTRTARIDSFDPLVVRLRAAGCVFAEEEAELLMDAASSPEVLESMAVRRVAGEPLEQVVGWAEFAGLRILLDPGVFVPRRRTEFLVSVALGLPLDPAPVVVDLCCGSGAVGAALLSALPGCDLYAADIEPAGVAIARRHHPPTPEIEGDQVGPRPAPQRRRHNEQAPTH